MTSINNNYQSSIERHWLMKDRMPEIYSVNFNGRNLSSETYFYALIADGKCIGTKTDVTYEIICCDKFLKKLSCLLA